MAKKPQIIDHDEFAGKSTAGKRRLRGVQRGIARVTKGTRRQARALPDAASSVKGAVQQIRKAVDPREMAGGFAGLTAGEAIGGTVGGVTGAVVGGPAGAIVGAEVGTFTGGMLGLKLGMDAVHDALEAIETAKDDAQGAVSRISVRRTSVAIGGKVKGRTGEIVGLTSGATVGLLLAGPVGGLLGAVVGETAGEHASTRNKACDAVDGENGEEETQENAAQWLNRFGKNTAGEAATILVAGSVGALFGPNGLKMGERLGRVVSRRVEWDKLGETVTDGRPVQVKLTPEQTATFVNGLNAGRSLELESGDRVDEDEIHL